MFKTICWKDKKLNYEINEKGVVRNSKTLKELKQRKDRYGYIRVTLYFSKKNGKAKYVNPMIHRLVALAFIYNDDPTNKTQVNHIDGNKTNNNIENLEWVTASENIVHAITNGLIKPPYGEKHSNSKFTEKQIHEVCRLLEEDKLSEKEIGDITKVGRKNVVKIKAGVTWKHISSLYNIPKPKKLSNLQKYHNQIIFLILSGATNKDIFKTRPTTITYSQYKSLVEYLRKKINVYLDLGERSTTIPKKMRLKLDISNDLV